MRLEPLVHIRVRLIQDQHLRTGNNGTSQQHTLQLSAGQLADRPARQIFQPHFSKHFFHTLFLACAVGTEKRLFRSQPRSDHLAHGDRELLIDIVQLRKIADPERRDRPSVLIKADRTGDRRQQAEHDLQQRRFSSPVRSDNPQEIIFPDRQRDIPQYGFITVSCRHMFYVNQFFH